MKWDDIIGDKEVFLLKTINACLNTREDININLLQTKSNNIARLFIKYKYSFTKGVEPLQKCVMSLYDPLSLNSFKLVLKKLEDVERILVILKNPCKSFRRIALNLFVKKQQLFHGSIFTHKRVKQIDFIQQWKMKLPEVMECLLLNIPNGYLDTFETKNLYFSTKIDDIGHFYVSAIIKHNY